MIKSIRYFLLVSLLLSITIASAINGIGNYLLDQKVIQPYLDIQLIHFSTLIDILFHSSQSKTAIRNGINNYLKTHLSTVRQKFFFHVLNNKNENLLSSDNHHLLILKIPLGFSDQIINGEDYRVYTSYDKESNLKILVGEEYNVRRELADDIAKSNAYILLVTYPVFGLLVWFIINLALRSITRVTGEISYRASTFLEPVQLTEIPVEIKPLVAELNQLFIRLQLAFERNKRFAADAAHELKTPLAALKTHLQVGLKATNEIDREKALEKVIESVDRSSHVVTQLLTLSRLEEEEGLTDTKPIDLHKIATEIIAYLAPLALLKNIEIELSPPPKTSIILGNEIAIGILIRNIVDNAIRYTPPFGEVKVKITESEKFITLSVIDTGPGIAPQLRDRVFERFYRILGTKASGSGLGLAIVSQIASLHHATLNLLTPAHHKGLQFDIAFPKYPA